MRKWFGLGLLASVLTTMVAGCAEPIPQSSERETLGEPEEELPVVGEFFGSFDGQELTLVPMDEAIERGLVGGARQPDSILGVQRQALDALDGGSFGTGVTATGANYVALEQVSRSAIINGVASGPGGWSTTQCGGNPTAPNNGGVCVQIRMRNLYSSELSRAYVKLGTFSPTGMTTSVFAPPSSGTSYTAYADFGLNGINNALWRYGNVGRNSPAGTGVTLRWAFHGQTTSPTGLTFTFTAQVRGLLMRPTVRATLANGSSDSPTGNYPDLAAAEGALTADGNIAVSNDGRYVAFASSSPALLSAFPGASGTHIFRKDLDTGALVLVTRNGAAVATGACTAANPSISGDGNLIAFEARGCSLTSLGVASVSQIYLRNVTGGTTTLVSAASGAVAFANRAALNPRVAAGGSAVAYNSDATNLVSTGHPGGRVGCQEVYRYRIATPQTRRVTRVRGQAATYWQSLATGTNTTNCSGNLVPGQEPDISADGNVVVYESGFRMDMTNDLVSNDVDVYAYREDGAVTPTVWRVSRTRAGGDPDGVSQNVAISGNGLVVAFVSSSTNLGPAPTSGREQIWARTITEGSDATLEMVSMTPADTESGTTVIATPFPALSYTGRFVSFWSAYLLETPYSSGGVQVHTCDRLSGSSYLSRCFVSSVAQLSPGAAFTPLNGNGAVRFRIGLGSSGSNDERAYVAYPGKGLSWAGMSVTGSLNEAFVSPVADPRYQMPTVSP